MDQAIIALLGVIITLMLYLDRGRRADLAQLRQEVHHGDARLREEMQRGFAHLTDMIMDLVNRVGRLEGRTDTSATPAQPSQ